MAINSIGLDKSLLSTKKVISWRDSGVFLELEEQLESSQDSPEDGHFTHRLDFIKLLLVKDKKTYWPVIDNCQGFIYSQEQP